MKQFFLERRRAFCLFAPAIFGLIYLTLSIRGFDWSVNYDESYNVYFTRFGVSDIFNFASNGANPPFYYLVLKAWNHFLGRDVYSMRLLSAVLGAITLFFVFKWAKYKYGAKVSILSAALLCICPFFIRAGQVVAPYALVLAEIFAGLYFLQLAIDTKEKKWWFLYGLILAAGLWTHYIFIFAWIAQLIYALEIYKEDLFKKKLFLAYLISIILFVPWVIAAFPWIKNIITGISLATIVDYFSELVIYLSTSEVKSWYLLLVLASVIALTYLLIKRRKKISVMRYLAFTPVAISVLSVIMLMGYIGVMAKKKKKSKRYLIAAICGIAFITTSVVGVLNVFEKKNYDFSTNTRIAVNSLYENIEALSHGTEQIIVSSPELYYELSVYETLEHRVMFIGESESLPLMQNPNARIASFEKSKEYWFIQEGLDFDKTALMDVKYKIVEEATLNLDELSPSYSLRKLSIK